MAQRYNFIVSTSADNDLARISKCLSVSSLKKLSESIIIKYRLIKEMPQIYQRIYYDNKTNTDYRRCVIKKYIVTYKIYQNQITILRIVSEKEDYLKSKYFNSK